MDENISGFFGPEPGYGQPDLRSFTPIPTSKAASCELYRGERAGRFRVYKCLKPQFRGDLLHEGILKKEFEAGYSLRHPNVCEIYSYMEIEGLGNCIEMEWIDGMTLEDYLKTSQIDERSFISIASQLCDALAYLHSRQVIHRDLKPSNIMLSHDGGIVKLIDFGLADYSASSILKSAAGTRWWVAPEVLAGGQADVRSDIYSLGAVLRMMTDAHRRCINRCTNPDPAKRYTSATQVKDALRSRRLLWPLAFLAVAALTAAVVSLITSGIQMDRSGKPTSHSDTIFIQQAPLQPAIQPSQEKKPADASKHPRKDASGKAKDVPADKGRQEIDNIDEIFEKASDLLEEKL